MTVLDLLLDPQAPAVLTAALAEYGGELCALDPVSATVRPDGAGVLVRYRAGVRRADGSLTTEVLVAATGAAVPKGAAVVAGRHGGVDVEVGVWRWPQDPALPGVGLLADPAAGLRRLGLDPAGPVRATVRTYRPGQRAVVEVGDGRRTWFVKIVRPAAVSALRARHGLFAPEVPVPPVAASSDDGVIVLPQAPGTPLRQLIACGGEVPDPARLETVLDALPAGALALPRRRGLLDRIGDTESVLRLTAAAHPDLLPTLPAIVEDLRTTPPPDEPDVPVHGDFYEGQLLAESGRVTALLDVDTAGPGQRADEWATFIGHLSVAGLTAPGAQSYATDVYEFACRRVDPAALQARIASVVFGLAIGPFRTCHPDWPRLTAQRLALARSWIDR